MPELTREELGKRLQRAREQAGFTQETAAPLLKLSRPVLAHIERGAREVTGMEVSAMARTYGVRVEDLLAGEAQPMEAMLISRFRAVTGMEQDPAILGTLTQLVETCRELRDLEEQIGQVRGAPALPRYEMRAPRTTMEAVRQGQQIAEQERARLRLGQQPISDIEALLTNIGLRVWSFSLPRGTSGLFFSHQDTGTVIVVHQDERPERRAFSHAHEYCHALVDRDQGTVVSKDDDQDPVEKRANAFSINFLAPEQAVRAYVEQNPLYDPSEPPAEVIVMAARHFGTSYDAMVYHLANIRVITKADVERCRVESTKKQAIARVRAVQGSSTKRETPPFSQWVVSVCVVALQKQLVTRSYVDELCDRVGISQETLERAVNPVPMLDDAFY